MFTNKDEFVKDFTKRIIETYGRSVAQAHPTEKYMVLGEMVRDYASVNWKASKESVATYGQKQMYYFSMEFLIGRLLTNNLMNLGIYNLVKDGLSEMNIDINQIEDLENDPGLGNGGLGRLAACFLDSLASLNLPGHGNTIRYEYGLFKQLIQNGYQVEVPDQWLSLGNIWEVRKPKHAVEVKFWGHVELSRDNTGKIVSKHVDCENVKAVPYDMPIVGKDTKVTNTLRLWRPEASEHLPKNKDFIVYINEVNAISQNVYPDDSSIEGRMLRIKQEYFFVSAGIQSMLKAHLRVYKTLDNFADKNIIQLNDTHPVLVIPELMRLFMDEYDYSWDDASNIVKSCIAYTNHTVLKEALEKWPVDYISRLLPRIYMIIEEINKRQKQYLQSKNYPGNVIEDMLVIKDNQVQMANLAIIASTSVNGVAAIHSNILKTQLFNNFYNDTPWKFNNKTNGISHRRWLLYSNPELVKLLDSKIGTGYHNDPSQLEKLMEFIDDPTLQADFLKVKAERKRILAEFLRKEMNIEIYLDSIYDVQAKRLHAYKRQLLNVLNIIYLYKKIKTDPYFTMVPRTFFFAAKAAPAYVFAKAVIKLINSVSEVISKDPKVSKLIQVVFIPNYRVSVAEVLMNAADISEQISTAGKEASGTGNMKFMMNGAITLGTLDGANVEIDELVGRDNDIIFGLTEEEVRKTFNDGYNVWDQYNNDHELKAVLDTLIDGTWGNEPDYKVVYDELMYRNDEYLLLKDFRSYVQAQAIANQLYLDTNNWAKMCLVNIAKSGFFSSDRTINQYASEIWKIEPINLKK